MDNWQVISIISKLPNKAGHRADTIFQFFCPWTSNVQIKRYRSALTDLPFTFQLMWYKILLLGDLLEAGCTHEKSIQFLEKCYKMLRYKHNRKTEIVSPVYAIHQGSRYTSNKKCKVFLLYACFCLVYPSCKPFYLGHWNDLLGTCLLFFSDNTIILSHPIKINNFFATEAEHTMLFSKKNIKQALMYIS